MFFVSCPCFDATSGILNSYTYYMTFSKLKHCFTYVTLIQGWFLTSFSLLRDINMTLVHLLLSGSCAVGVIFWVCGQGFSQKGVLPSYGQLFFEEIQGKFTQSLIILWENMPSGGPVFNVWLKECVWEMLQLKVHPPLLLGHTKKKKTNMLYIYNSALFCQCH